MGWQVISICTQPAAPEEIKYIRYCLIEIALFILYIDLIKVWKKVDERIYNS